jgi:alpha-D-xyloside xylohydrolase
VQPLQPTAPNGLLRATNALDYWVTAEDKPEFILQNYVRATGLPPMMPDYAMGFWQCKLRYRTQDEVLAVAREYHRRGIQLDVLVIDFFHWTQQGEWKFDPRYFPDPDAMITELKSMGIETMVSIWPTVDFRSENYHEMLEKGFLVHCNRGVQTSMLLLGDQAFFDATDPNARVYVWQKILENYFKKGIKLFWLDVAEPEYTSYDFDHYRYALGQVERVGNMYPVLYAKAFYDGLREQGVTNVLNLIRCAWAGSQQYGTLVWSGDIGTDFETLRNQLAAGLSMAMAGIPWWTTDIGGFHGGDQNDPAYRELLLRWFQWGTFCPVMRLHGHRLNGPTDLPEGECGSGGPNEIWSYGEEAYEIMKTHIKIRNKLKPYLKVIMHSAHEKGDAVMSPLFLRFPEDQDAWEVNDEYMLGPDLLVAPVLTAGARKRNVYLPKGANWIDSRTGERFAGGHIIASDAPLQNIPTFYREGGMLK